MFQEERKVVKVVVFVVVVVVPFFGGVRFANRARSVQEESANQRET